MFWAEMGMQVFVVEREACWVFGGELGIGLWWWVFCECRGGVGGAREGCVALVREMLQWSVNGLKCGLQVGSGGECWGF